jgi:hypothetical protein
MGCSCMSIILLLYHVLVVSVMVVVCPMFCISICCCYMPFSRYENHTCILIFKILSLFPIMIQWIKLFLFYFLPFYNQPNFYCSSFSCCYFPTIFESLLQLIYFLHDILLFLTI